ncbi:potassium channel family protein [Nitrosomonas marina]|uniref:Trk K+ transport system, NAD-binding component n=1 Tax=Nitrosomonas marina TaxID=917 RepID=A0A1H8FFU1_9PROT|nr:potassium channel protein [Nitrosomonas marina]SEN30485.1 Trk K+ transport system, NAD-binding component [Nitrosomonas marina]
MNNIIFLILRRMRIPLIAVIVSFGFAVGGLTLMPGIVIDGEVSYLSLFQAFYIISYTATTIGFGEVPHEFSTMQRLWMTFSIYLTVIVWFYAIGKIITLFQDVSLKIAVTTARFARSVDSLSEPFYIICGYGETGSLLVNALDHKNIRVVVIDILQLRINELELEDFQYDIPALCADACLPDILIKAGARHPLCAGVAALTDSDQANLAIAISIKLVNPALMVLGRAENVETASNMASFGTDHIINPYTLFGEYLAMEVHALGTYLLHEWLTGVPERILQSPVCPPIGKWVVCGYGRFGKSVVKNLQREHMTTVIVEANPELTGCKEYILGSGAEARTLEEAGIRDAVGIVAGTDNDINNLSIVITAREINPDLFVVIRKNKRYNDILFEQFRADISMQPSDIIAHACLAHMVSPLLAQFLLLARNQSNKWANQLIAHLVSVVGEQVPETWSVTVDYHSVPAVATLVSQGIAVSIDNLRRDPGNRDIQLDLVPLMVVRENDHILLPDYTFQIKRRDQILFCGRTSAKNALAYVMNDPKTLNYIISGKEIPDSLVWRWISQKLKR